VNFESVFFDTAVKILQSRIRPTFQWISELLRYQNNRNNDNNSSKNAKYSSIQAHHIFQPVAVESLGPINASGRVFPSKLGRKEISFLFQRLSVLIQRYNAILLHDCFVKEGEE